MVTGGLSERKEGRLRHLVSVAEFLREWSLTVHIMTYRQHRLIMTLFNHSPYSSTLWTLVRFPVLQKPDIVQRQTRA